MTYLKTSFVVAFFCLLVVSQLNAKNKEGCGFSQDTLSFYINTDVDAAKNYVANHLDRQDDPSKCRYMSYLNALSVESIVGNKNSVDSIYSLIEKHELKETFPKLFNRASQLLASFYINNSYNDEAKSMLLKSIASPYNTSRDSIRTLVNLAILFNNLKDFNQSITYLQKAIDVYEKSNLKEYILKLDVVGQLAVCYINIYNYEAAITALDTCISVAKINSMKRNLTYYYSYRSMCYEEISNPNQARADLDSASNYLSYDPSMFSALMNQKAVHFGNQKNYAKAEEVFIESIEFSEKSGNRNYLLNALKNITFYMGKQGKVSGYKKYLDKLKNCCQDLLDTQDSIILRAYDLVERVAMKDKSLALSLIDHYEFTNEYHDQEVREKLNDALVKYQSEKKDLENSQLREVQKIKEATISKQKKTLFIAGLGLLTLCFLLFLLYRQRDVQKKLNTQLIGQRDQIKLLNREINHRVKNNLAFMSSLIEMQGRRTNLDETKQALRESETRLKALSLVHVNLFKEENA